MSSGAVKSANRQKVGGSSGGSGGIKMGGDSLTEGDLPPTEDIRPEHVLR